MAKHRPLFRFRDEFAAFLPDHGVPRAGSNYVTWMNRAAKRLARFLGPEHLSNEQDVQHLMSELEAVDRNSRTLPYIKNKEDWKNQRSAFRKYAQMVQSNFRGLFLASPASQMPLASDLSDAGIPASVKQTIHRKIRDTAISRQVKRRYEFRCQVCGERLEIEPGVFYAEAHHLKPLGGEHRGPDIEENLIRLCPNHHALFDYFAVPLDVDELMFSDHALGAEFVDYHNAHVSKGATRKVGKHSAERMG